MFKKARESKAAGRFYPSNANELRQKINNFLQSVPDAKLECSIKAIIAPHAGYDFSGLVAAHAYKLLVNKKIKTAVIVCNSHTSYFNSIAIDNHDVWYTPLGEIKVDLEMAKKIVKENISIDFKSEPFNTNDQTIEVQLPFLQVVLQNNFKILPIYFGNAGGDDYKILAKSLFEFLEEDDLIIASTDLSHYPSYNDALYIDKGSLDVIKLGKSKELNLYIERIMAQNIADEETVMCGEDGVKTVLELASLGGWENIEILKYANSGDVPEIGDKTRVVGYGAVAFMKKNTDKNNQHKAIRQNSLSEEQKKELLNIASEAVKTFVTKNRVQEFFVKDERLNRREGAFVTIYNSHQLRGCIGRIVSTSEPLWKVVRDMAIAACSEDDRFDKITNDELSEVNYEISVLSEPKKIDRWQDVELGKHGVMIKRGGRTGVFLPQVAVETGWSKEKFLSELCSQKTGVAADAYKDKETDIFVFTAQIVK